MSVITKEKKSELLSFIESNKITAKIRFSGNQIIIRKSMIKNDGFRSVMNWIGMHFIAAGSEWARPSNGKQTVYIHVKSER